MSAEDPKLDPQLDPKPDDAEIRRRQKGRAIVMGVLLGLFVILVYAITIAKMSVNR
ncbi:MAG: hypothetical protein JWO81_1897 [Alphaproteobacteria bacterium]|nr:hypothetical protein [Alphaproteobacteria bacterium]